MATFPIVKSSDVNAAAGQVSRHSTRVSGTNLNISANITVIMQNETPKFIASRRSAEAGSSSLRNFSATDNPALTNRKLSNRNPVATTSRNDHRRCVSWIVQKLFLLLSTFQ